MMEDIHWPCGRMQGTSWTGLQSVPQPDGRHVLDESCMSEYFYVWESGADEKMTSDVMGFIQWAPRSAPF